MRVHFGAIDDFTREGFVLSSIKLIIDNALDIVRMLNIT